MRLAVLVGVAMAACVAGRGPGAPVAETCAVRLPVREEGAAVAGEEGAFVVARSTLVVGVEIPVAGVRGAIEGRVGRRVAEERDHDLGIAGHLEYTVDRGPFTVRAENEVLVVESILQGRAQACAKGRCYAGCTPEARFSARVPLRLGPDYRLHTSEVRIDVTRGCEVRAALGLVTIDVTPILRGALGAQTRSIQASIDRELPDLRPEAARLWDELGKARTVPLGGCILLGPEEITQGRSSSPPELVRLRFGLLARPELRMQCASAAAPPRPLPALRDDPALPPSGDVHLAIVLAPDAPARAAESAEPIDLVRGRSRVRAATGDAGTGLVLDLAGEVCGDVGIRIGGVAWADPQSLHLTDVTPLPGDAARLSASGIDPTRLARGIESAPLRLPIAVSVLPTLLPELAGSLSDERITLAATVESALPETAGRRGTDVVAVALLRGSVTIRAK